AAATTAGAATTAPARAAATCAPAAASATLPTTPLLPLSTPGGQPIASAPLELLPAPARTLTTIEPLSTPSGQPPAGAAAPAPTTAAPSCTTQFVGVDVGVVAGPLGVAFDSRATVGGRSGVRIGQSFYATPANGSYAIFLDAATLGELGTAIVPAGANAEGYATALALAYALQHQVLIVLSGPDFTLVKRFGEGDDTAISNEGLVEGDGSGAVGAPGQLTGWLQRSIPLDTLTPTYRLVQPDRVTIDTSAAATASGNTIAVGGATYASALPPGATAGFQVLVLDPALRPQLGTPAAFGTNGGDAATAAAQQGALSGLLRRAAATTAATVVVQSIGRPAATALGSLTAAQQIERLGGSEWMFLGLDGSGGYALIGNTPALGAATNDQPSAEASSQWTRHGADSLSGLLRRRHDGAFHAALADSVGGDGLDFSLQQVAFQPATPWPEQGRPGEAAAAAWIARQLGLPTHGGGLCAPTQQPDVRAQYCNLAVVEDPDGLQSEIAALDYARTSAFSATDLTTVQRRLHDELDDVATVWNVIGTLQQPFALSQGSTAIAAGSVAADVMRNVEVKPASPVSAELGLASAILYGVAEIPEIGEAFGAWAAALDLASVLTEEDDEPSPDWDIQIAADEAGGAIDGRLVGAYEALGAYGSILVSDAGKLAAAADAAKGPWGQSASGQATKLAAMRLGIKQWLYTAIVPAAYDLVRVPGAVQATARKDVECVYSGSPASWHPFGKADPATLFFPLNDWAGSAPKADQLMGMLHGSFASNRSQAAGSELAGVLFGDPDDGDAGLVASWFYDRATWTIQRPKMLRPSSPLEPGWCQAGRVG
ncbi:hypothetical protein VSS74_28705, partial [Conexibacter stalactiti]